MKMQLLDWIKAKIPVELNDTQVAELLGMHYTTYKNKIAGTNRFNIEELIKFAIVFDVDLNEVKQFFKYEKKPVAFKYVWDD